MSSEQIPGCALDASGLRTQRDRYGRLASDVASMRREPYALLVEFREGFDRAALDEALAVERECCPFFEFELDSSGRVLRAAVSEPEELPALGAVAAAFGAVARS